MKKRHGHEAMQRLFEQRAKEKLTLKELARRSGIPTATLGYWSSKFRRERREGGAAPELVPVELVDRVARAPICIEVGARVRVHVEPNFDAAHLTRLIRVLAARC